MTGLVASASPTNVAALVLNVALNLLLIPPPRCPRGRHRLVALPRPRQRDEVAAGPPHPGDPRAGDRHRRHARRGTLGRGARGGAVVRARRPGRGAPRGGARGRAGLRGTLLSGAWSRTTTRCSRRCAGAGRRRSRRPSTDATPPDGHRVSGVSATNAQVRALRAGRGRGRTAGRVSRNDIESATFWLPCTTPCQLVRFIPCDGVSCAPVARPRAPGPRTR